MVVIGFPAIDLLICLFVCLFVLFILLTRGKTSDVKHRAIAQTHFWGFGERGSVFTLTKVAAAIGRLQSENAFGEDKILPKMLKLLNGGVSWLTKVSQVAWELGKTPKDWKKSVITVTAAIKLHGLGKES